MASAVFTPAPASDDLADAMTAEMTDEQLAAEQLPDGIVVSESIGTAANVPLNLICPAPSAPVARWAPSIPGGVEFALPTEALALILSDQGRVAVRIDERDVG